ncbi:MAG: T9SS type A sorting domain-containing protein [Bacteroidetes bacterium]|nr:T9SS type A sorting domain-containing protein [Bacteroidota bacterium]
MTGSSVVQAQSTLPKVWLDTAGTFVNGVAAGPQWFKRPFGGGTGDLVRGMAFNPATGHVLVATRDSAYKAIMILDGANGDTLGRLDMTGVATGAGTFPFNRVAVSGDGRIYTMNLQTAVSKTAPVRIYTWANEGAAPIVAFSDSLRGPRIGDALTVVGSGQETYVFVAGNATPGVVNVLKRSGDTLVFYKEITPTGWASGVLGIGPVGNGMGDFWLNTAGKPAIKYDSTGAPKDTVGTGIVSSGASTAKYFEFGGRKFLAMFAGNVTPSVVRVVDITNGGLTSYVVGVTAALGNYANANGTGEVHYNAADTTLIALGTNNGVGKFSIPLSQPGVTYNDRFPYVPMAGEPDTVYFNLLSMKPFATAEVKYYGYRSASSDQNGVDSGAVTLTQSSGRVYSAIVPGSVNRDGRRVNFVATVKDVSNQSFTSPVIPGYFAGTTKMAYKGGPRDIDSVGGILWANYGIRIEGVCIQEDSITQRINLDVNFQDDMGAMTVFNPLANGGIKQKIKRGNRYSVVARIQAFNGKVQIREERTGHPTPAFTDLGPGMPIIPKVVTVKELNDNGELYENSLVAVKNINFTATSPAWPAAGATGTALNLRVTDNGTDTVTMRPAEFGGLSGNPIPGPWPLVVGVAGQFDASSPRLWDYQFIPRDSNDFKYVPATLGLPIHFEDPMVSYDFINFSGATTMKVPNPFKTGMDTSGFVAKTVKGAGDPWAGSFLTLSAPVDLTKGKIFKAKVYMPKVGAKMLFKLEHLTNGAINKEVDVAATKANEWEELTFDFSSVNDTVKFQKVVVIFDLGTVGDGGANFTYYFDDIRQTKPVPVYQDPKMMPAFASKNVVKVDGILDEPIWQANTPFLVFGSPAFHPDSMARTVTNGAIVKPSPKHDESFTQLKFARRGPHMFVGFRSKDLSVSRFGDSWEGDGLFMKIKNAQGVDKEFKLYYNLPGNSAMHYEATDSSHGFGVGVKHPATIVNDTTAADSGYSAELVIKLDSLGFTKFDSVMVMVNIFDPDGYTGTGTPWGAIGSFHKSWWGSEWGPEMRVVKFMPDSSLTGVPGTLLPVEFALEQNYPNPFNPSTTIQFALPSDASVRLTVYDILGREVRSLVNTDMAAGYHNVAWDGRNNKGTSVASGIYIYRIEAGQFISTKKMMLLK